MSARARIGLVALAALVVAEAHAAPPDVARLTQQISDAQAQLASGDVWLPQRPLLQWWLLAALAELRDGAWSGCAPCAAFLREFTLRDAVDAAAAERFAASLRHGPPGALGDAARALLDALVAPPQKDARDAWAAAAPYVDDGPIRVDEWNDNSGADNPVATRAVTRLHGAAGLRRWRAGKNDVAPERGESLWCAGSCCELPFADDRPHKYAVTKLCFDRRLRLRALETRHSGM